MGMPMCAAGKGGFGAPTVSTNKQVARPGDWICPNPQCQDVQFERNDTCRKCGTAKPRVSSNRQVFKQGDWICPNPQCADVQFERNHICRKCGTPKPVQDGDGGAAFGGFGEPRQRSRSPLRMSS